MLHGNVSRKGYGNALWVGMVAILRKDIMRLMYGGSANNRILTLVKGTHSLIIGNSLSSQEIHKETSTPRRSVWGFGYPCASSNHDNVRLLYILQPLQRLVIDPSSS